MSVRRLGPAREVPAAYAGRHDAPRPGLGKGDDTGMNVLIIDCGSSSQTFGVYRVAAGHEPAAVISGKARNVATAT